MSWYYNVLAAQAAQKQQQAQQAAKPPQGATITQPGGAPQPYSGPSPVPPEPGTAQDIVRQTAPTPASPSGNLWVRSDYQANVVSQYSTPSGIVTTYDIVPKYVAQTPPSVVAPIIGKNMVGAEPSMFGNPLKGQVLFNTPTAKTLGLAAVVSVVAPEIIPGIISGVSASSVVTGELIGAGFNEVPVAVKAFQGQPVSVGDVAAAGVVGAAQGAVFAGVGGAAVRGVSSVAKLAGVGLPAGVFAREAVERVGRVGLNTVIGAGAGAGVEYVQTGNVTSQGVVSGAAFGAAFGAAGELAGIGNARYGVSGKVSGKVQDVSINKNLGMLEQINDRYVTAYNANELYQPTFRENLVMKVTGLSPVKPSLQTVSMPDIPTAELERYMSYTKPVTREFTDTITVTNAAKTEVVDQFQFKNEVVENKVFKLEKPMEPTSYRNIVESNLQEKTLANAEMVDAGTVIMGKSVSPDEYYAKNSPSQSQAKELPEYNAKGTELIPVESGRSLSFKKTGTEGNILEPTKMFAERTKAFQSNGMPDELETAKIYSQDFSEPQRKIGNFSKPPVIKGLKGLEENINVFPKVESAPAADAAIQGSQKYTVSDMNREEVLNKLENDWGYRAENPTLGAKKTSSSIIQELTGGYAASPTGTDKVMSDIQSGRTIETDRVSSKTLVLTPSVYSYPIVAEKSKTETALSTDFDRLAVNQETTNPFTASKGRSYYQQRNRQAEDAETFVSYPNSGLPNPALSGERPLTFEVSRTQFGQKASGDQQNPQVPVFAGSAELFNPQLTSELPILSDLTGQSPISTPIYGVDQPVLPIQDQPISTIPIIDSPTQVRSTPAISISQPVFDKTVNSAFLPTFKFEGGGFNMPNRRRVGVRSRKQVTPILSGEAILASAFGKNNALGKTSKTFNTAFRATSGKGIAEYKTVGKALKFHSSRKGDRGF